LFIVPTILAARNYTIVEEKRFVNNEIIEKNLLLVEKIFRANPFALAFSLMNCVGVIETV